MKKQQHSWQYTNQCQRCGLKRKYTRIAPLGGLVYGRPTTLFLVNGTYQMIRTPTCKA